MIKNLNLVFPVFLRHLPATTQPPKNLKLKYYIDRVCLSLFILALTILKKGSTRKTLLYYKSVEKQEIVYKPMLQ